MEAGKLNKIISIESVSSVSDGAGSSTETWTTYASPVWASIWPVSAKEIIQAGVEIMSVTHRIRIRYRTGLTPKMRLKYGSVYYDIVSIRNLDSDNRIIEILGRERV